MTSSSSLYLGEDGECAPIEQTGVTSQRPVGQACAVTVGRRRERWLKAYYGAWLSILERPSVHLPKMTAREPQEHPSTHRPQEGASKPPPLVRRSLAWLWDIVADKALPIFGLLVDFVQLWALNSRRGLMPHKVKQVAAMVFLTNLLSQWGSTLRLSKDDKAAAFVSMLVIAASTILGLILLGGLMTAEVGAPTILREHQQQQQQPPAQEHIWVRESGVKEEEAEKEEREQHIDVGSSKGMGKGLCQRILVESVATFLSLIPGVFYLPILETGLSVAIWAWDGHRVGYLTGSVITLAAFLPFCLFITQNSYDDDERSRSPIKQRHNRLAFGVIVAKSLTVIGQQLVIREGRLLLAWVNLLGFCLLFTMHFLTQAFWLEIVNRAVNGLYLVLVAGAVYHIAAFTMNDLYWHGVPTDWIVLPLCFVAGYWGLGLQAAPTWLDLSRDSANAWLVHTGPLRFFDLSDSPELIHRLGLAHLLHSPTRQGAYAHYLAQLQPPQPKQVEHYFRKALRADPRHPDVLGWYAAWLVTQGRLDEAQSVFLRALRASPQHRENLEGYAYFLNRYRENKVEDSLSFYQKALLEYKGHYRFLDLYANSADGMCILRLDGQLLDCNGAALKMLHARNRPQLLTMPMLELVAAEDRPAFNAALKNLGAGALSVQLEMDVVSLMGQRLATSTVVTFIRRTRGPLAAGAVIGGSSNRPVRRKPGADVCHISMTDITPIKRLMQLNRAVFESAASPLVLADEEGTIIQANHKTTEIFGYLESELVGSNVTVLMPEDIRQRHPGFMRRYLETGERRIIGYPRQVLGRTKDGRVLVMELLLNEIQEAGTGRRLFIAVLHDITELKRLMRLNEAVIESAASPLVLADEDGKILQANHTTTEVFGFSQEELVGSNVTVLMAEHIREQHAGFMQRYLRTGERRVIGYRRQVAGQTKDGRALVLELLLNEVDGIGTGRRLFIAVLHDITELKRLMRLNETVINSAASPLVLADEDGKILQANHTTTEVFGFSQEELVGSNVTVLMAEHIREQHAGFMQRYLRTGERRVIGHRRQVAGQTKDGRALVLELLLNEVDGIGTGRRLFIAVLHDITELKRLMRLNEAVIESAASPLVLADEDGKILQANHTTTEVFGFSQEELVGSNVTVLMAEHIREQHAGFMQRYLRTGERRVIGYRRQVAGQTKDGRALVLELLLNEVDGIGTGRRLFIAVLHDITELKRLMRLNEAIFDSAASPLVLADEDGKILQANYTTTEVFGFSQEELVGSNVTVLMAEHIREQHAGFMQRYLRTGERRVIGHRRQVAGQMKDGRALVLELLLNEVDGIGTGRRLFIAVLHDITELKRLMRLNEAIFDSAASPLVLADEEGRILQANRKTTEIFAYPQSELVGSNVTVLMPEHIARQHAGFMQRYLKTGERRVIGHRREVEGRTKSGHALVLELLLNSLEDTDDTGKRLFIAVLHDITELRRLMRLNEAVLESVASPIVVADEQGIILQANLQATEVFGYSQSELVGSNLTVLMPDETAQQHAGFMQRYLQTGERRVIGYPRKVVGASKAGTAIQLELLLNEVDVTGSTNTTTDNSSNRSTSTRLIVHNGGRVFVAILRVVTTEHG